MAGSAGVAGSAGQGGSAGGQAPQGGTGSMGGGAGSSGFEPCPTDGNPCVILPLGDSITDGVGSTDLSGYRSPLFKLIVQANQKATFVGSRSSGPEQVSGKPFPKSHEGHPGWTIDSGYVSFGDGISTLVPLPAFKTIPHIVLLMIGTNDVSASKGTDMIATRLDTLLDKIVQAAPKSLVVVAQLTPIGWNPAAATSYNAKIPGIVQARISKGQHLAVVDMSKMPTANLNSDSLHPNDTGYAFMAGVWYAAIKDQLPQ
jgi:GDSL-like Lipase/Acylhydrolase family